MARVTYTVYKNSILATLVSFLSQAMGMVWLIAAIVALVNGEFSVFGIGAVLFVVFGIGGALLAESINTLQCNSKWWKETVRKQGWEAKIPNSADACFAIYNANPCKWTLNKIRKLNPSAAAQIQQALPAKK